MEPQSAHAPAVTRDARREHRFRVDKLITLMPWGGEGGYQSRKVRLLDCSAHGLGVESAVPMQLGDQFAVYLQLAQVTMVLYTVRHCTKTPTGAYKIGAKLFGLIGSDGIDADRALIAMLEHGLA